MSFQFQPQSCVFEKVRYVLSCCPAKIRGGNLFEIRPFYDGPWYLVNDQITFKLRG